MTEWNSLGPSRGPGLPLFSDPFLCGDDDACTFHRGDEGVFLCECVRLSALRSFVSYNEPAKHLLLIL
jgi:hypothetical protein